MLRSCRAAKPAIARAGVPAEARSVDRVVSPLIPCCPNDARFAAGRSDSATHGYDRGGSRAATDVRGDSGESGLRSIELEVRTKSGLHARPAAEFVRAAAGFESTVRLANVTLGRPTVDAKSIIGVLGAGVERGHFVRIEADGIDDERAIGTLGELLARSDRPSDH
jgi:phosphotransferase system HPr (HPr) family protein